jgi:hypothetical protein
MEAQKMTKMMEDIEGMSPQHMGRRLQDLETREAALEGKHGEKAKKMAEKMEARIIRIHYRIQMILSKHDLAIYIDPPEGVTRHGWEGMKNNRTGFGAWPLVPVVSDRGYVGCVDTAPGVAYETNVMLSADDRKLCTIQSKTAISHSAQPASGSGGIPEGWAMVLPRRSGVGPIRDCWKSPDSHVTKIIYGLTTCYRTVGTMPKVPKAGITYEESKIAEERIGEAPIEKSEEIAKQTNIKANVWSGGRAFPKPAFGMGKYDIMAIGTAEQRGKIRAAFRIVMAEARTKAMEKAMEEWDRCSGWKEAIQ